MDYKIIAISNLITDSLSVIIPAYNEGKRITRHLFHIDELLTKKAPNSEIIVINDGSTDNTDSIVKDIGAHIQTPLTCLHKPNGGKGSAVQVGMLLSNANLKLFTDADGSTNIKELLPVYQALIKSKSQIAIGSRSLKKSKILTPQPFHRKITGNALKALTRMTILPGIHDTQCGFKLFTKNSADILFPRQTMKGFSFDLELLYLARLYGLSVVEVPITWEDKEDSTVEPLKEGFRFLKAIGTLILNKHLGRYLPPTNLSS